ncbi:MAG: DegT/DnrJ/EryC1/StrS family aminotransferase [Proteobacteria bacterium]|nr:DegT/DnrJ/EryC1/StrS family aminotransferase [Pseudomonadota bacterium]
MLKSPDVRERLKIFLNQRGIQAVSHYEPLHSSVAGVKYGRVSGALTNTDTVASCILRLPLFADLGVNDQDRIIECVFDFFKTENL